MLNQRRLLRRKQI